MAIRHIVIGVLIFATLVIPLVQLSIGFHYIDKQELCPIQHDITLLMAIGGFFEIIFFAVAFAFIYSVTPSKYKEQKVQSVAQKSAKGNNRASLILIGCITGILGACAIIFFILIQFRVYSNFQRAQWTNSSSTTYCQFTIYSSAFGLMITTYLAFVLLFTVAIILMCGIGAPKK